MAKTKKLKYGTPLALAAKFQPQDVDEANQRYTTNSQIFTLGQLKRMVALAKATGIKKNDQCCIFSETLNFCRRVGSSKIYAGYSKNAPAEFYEVE